METMIITATAMFLASLVMGLTGFGFAMVGIGIMSMCVPIKTIIPFIFPYNVLMNIVLIWQLKAHLSVARVIPQLLFFLPGGLVGSLLLVHWADASLKVMVGITLVGFSLWGLIQPEPILSRSSTLWSGIAGFSAGLLGGALYMPGPPVIVYNTAIASDQFQFKVDLQLFFLFTNIFLLFGYASLGLFSCHSLKMTLYYSPCIALGLFAGLLIFRKLTHRKFKAVSTLVLACLGAGILARTLL